MVNAYHTLLTRYICLPRTHVPHVYSWLLLLHILSFPFRSWIHICSGSYLWFGCTTVYHKHAAVRPFYGTLAALCSAAVPTLVLTAVTILVGSTLVRWLHTHTLCAAVPVLPVLYIAAVRSYVTARTQLTLPPHPVGPLTFVHDSRRSLPPPPRYTTTTFSNALHTVTTHYRI